MHANHNVGASQQRLVKKHARNSDAYAFFNLLTSEHLLDTVESLLPKHRNNRGQTTVFHGYSLQFPSEQ